MPDAPESATARLTVVPAGTMAYETALALQRQLHGRVVAGESGAFLVLVEHPPVLTFGKHADHGHLLFAKADCERHGIALIDTDRGGEVTAHEPGQLVAYPIVRLADFGLAPRRYVTMLETAVIRVLAGFGVRASTDPQYPGVWVGTEKICALGIRIKDRVSLHGLALNVSNDLKIFERIVPCGIQGRGVTSLTRLLGRPVTTAEVAPRLIAELAGGLGVPVAATKMLASLQWEAGVFSI